MTFLVFSSSLDAQAISFDDDEYLLDNGLVQNPSWASAKEFLVEVLEPTTVRGYYQPLAMISLMLDYALGGRTDNLRPFHLTSVLLHVMNTVLVVILLYQLFGSPWAAAGVGLLFGVHPLAIESIPWIAERKTLLATFFALGSLVMYVRYTRRGSRVSYATALLACVLALMSKPSATPLPLLLVLLDYWPLDRLNRRSVGEKIPFFLVAGLFAIVTFLSQHKTYGTTLLFDRSPWSVLLLITHNIVFYLSKLAWPGELSWYYEYPQPFDLTHPAVLRGVVGTLLLLASLAASLRWTKACLTGFLFFLVGVLPTMSGVAFFGLIAADRFVYLPSVGLFLCLAAFLARLSNKGSPDMNTRSPWLGVAAYSGLAVWTVALATSTHRHLGYWQDSETLSRHMARMAPQCATARVGLGNALLAKGRSEEAIAEYRQALLLAPNEEATHTGLATALTQLGQLAEAVVHYHESLRLEPDNARAMNNLGAALAKQNRHEQAVEQFRAAIELRPRYAQAHLNLAASLQALGKNDEAVKHASTAVRLAPDDSKAHQHLGGILLRHGKASDAADAFRKALELKPGATSAHGGLGSALLSMGDAKGAVTQFQEAVHRQPGDAEWHRRLGDALDRLGRKDEATIHWKKAVELRPDHAAAQFSLANTLYEQGNAAEAVEHYEQALRASPNNVDIRRNLGAAWLMLGSLDDAVVQFQSAVALSPDDPELRYQLGMTLQQLERLNEAIEQYGHALRIQPDRPDVLNNLGAALADQDRLDEAAAQFRRGVTLYPTSAVLHANLADVLARQGQTQEALSEYGEALRLEPSNAHLHYRIGEILVQIGHKDRAVAEFREAVRLEPNHAEANERLNSLGGSAPAP